MSILIVIKIIVSCSCKIVSLLTGAGNVQSLLAQLLVPVSLPSDPSVI